MDEATTNGVVDLSGLATEAIDPRYGHLDELSTTDIVLAMNEAEQSVPAAVRAVAPAIAGAIDAIAERMSRGGRLFYVGAGTPGRLGVLDASECPPTFHTDPELVQAIIAGGPSAVFRSVEGAEDRADDGAAAIAERGVTADDSVVGITASGRTPYVLGAVEEAGRRGALTVGLCCNPHAALSSLVAHPLEVVVGPEVLAGSTRLKAGSAQKQVLNAISTTVMVRLGKTYGNLMVDVTASNAKLRARALRLVQRITGADQADAAAALAAADHRVPQASVMLARGVDAAEADRLVTAAGGRLADILHRA
ncbi:glucokinase regulatory-like protein [Beutenbergia cavernae DSM 12333]|uniref:N-acetylmuramic acid 6-phosphate etherase n=1 Tax=Beutenbergia cavernae (strain ATCC BAA-8 / DSM 12333 / CCUG 43141 / JCM 11478 / NBRC 16432 / NCIMB 13614 / HKI 0122) TaxID=471853 RepID=C5BWH6_BEUC1|nr:N-acetylmuramic acid 6-phosphate etherase [Beutenbergia cavernae]ACQ78634.1 glucokinase regulatory-like protein [Beutenbergia cavernae DSM 12333]